MKICVARKYGGIGDILMMTPILQALSLAGHNVSVAIDLSKEAYYLVLENNEHITQIYDYEEVDKSQFDKFFDLTSVAYPYERAGLILSRQQIFANAVGVTIQEEKPVYRPTKGYPVDNLVALHFFAEEERRSWPVAYAIKLVKFLLLNTNVKILLLDTKEYIKTSSRIISCRNLNIEESSRYLWGARFFVGVDSSWMHIAAALDIPGIVLFGSTNAKARISKYRYLEPISTPSDCNSCFYKQCNTQYVCMELIRPELIIEKIKSDALLL